VVITGYGGNRQSSLIYPLHLQHLDRCCKRVAEVNLGLVLFGVAWRLLGQLVALETLVYVYARPKVLQLLHNFLATKMVSLSAALHRLGLTSTPLLPGDHLGRCFSLMMKLQLHLAPLA
jgi:hypothetical protein